MSEVEQQLRMVGPRKEGNTSKKGHNIRRVCKVVRASCQGLSSAVRSSSS